MVRKFRYIIISITLFTLPFLLYFNFIAITEGNEKTIDSNFFEYYLNNFPLENIDLISEKLGDINNIGFKNTNLDLSFDYSFSDYDWSGGVIQDIEVLGQALGDFFNRVGEFFVTIGNYFVAIGQYIWWFIQVIYLIMLLTINTIMWLLKLPYFLRIYSGQATIHSLII